MRTEIHERQNVSKFAFTFYALLKIYKMFEAHAGKKKLTLLQI